MVKRRPDFRLAGELGAGLFTLAIIAAACGGGGDPAPAEPAPEPNVPEAATQAGTDTATEAGPDTSATPIRSVAPTDPPPVAPEPAAPPSNDLAPPPSDIAQPDAEAVMALRLPTVVIDPGHGGDDSGAALFGVVERDSNLDLALRVEAILDANGVRAVLTRRDAGRAVDEDAPAGGFRSNRADLQARVDLANAEGAAAYVSIHSNGSINEFESGVEVWYDPNRPFSDENVRLATLLQNHIVAELSGNGYAPFDRGIKNDSCWRFSERTGSCFPLFVLGPAREILRADILRFGRDPADFGFGPEEEVRQFRATQMPAALVEALFISNPTEAALLQDETARDAIARGIAEAVLAFLRGTPTTG